MAIMKPFLLIAGYTYYPNAGNGDWVKTFETREEAEAFVKKGKEYSLFRPKYELQTGDIVEWYEIIDLRDWI